MLSSPEGAPNTRLEPENFRGSAIKKSPVPDAAAVRRQTLHNFSKDEQRAIAFLNAEEKMLALRLSRRYRDPVRAQAEARQMIQPRVSEIFQRRETESLPQGRTKGKGRGSYG